MRELSLLPCPFCGGAAEEGEITHGDDVGGCFVECTMCGASTNLKFACGDDPRPQLREQWNRRAAFGAVFHAFLDSVQNSQHPISYDAMQTLREHLGHLK